MICKIFNELSKYDPTRPPEIVGDLNLRESEILHGSEGFSQRLYVHPTIHEPAEILLRLWSKGYEVPDDCADELEDPYVKVSLDDVADDSVIKHLAQYLIDSFGINDPDALVVLECGATSVSFICAPYCFDFVFADDRYKLTGVSDQGAEILKELMHQ